MFELLLAAFLIPFLFLRKSIFSVFFVYLASWLAQVLFLVFYNGLSPISIEAFLSLALFIFPSLIAFYLIEKKVYFDVKTVNFRFHIAGLLLIIFNCYLASVLFASIDSESVFQYYYLARIVDIEGSGGVSLNPLLLQIQPFAFAYTVAWSYFFQRNSQLSVTLTFILLIISSLVLMTAYGARSGAFYFLLIIFSIFAWRGFFSLKQLFALGGAFLSVFFITTFLMRTSGLEEEGGIFSRLINDVIVYFFAGLPAYSMFLDSQLPVIDNDLNYIVNIYQPDKMIFLQVGENVHTNVYTVFSSYLYFFGAYGYIVYFLINLVSIIFIRLFRKHLVAKVFLPFFIAYLLLSPFQNYFFTFIPYFTRALIILFLIGFLSRIGIRRYFFGRKTHLDLSVGNSSARSISRT